MADALDTSHLSGQFVGSGVVTGAFYGRRHTLLHLRTFRGESIEYRLNGVPEPAGTAGLAGDNLRPASVKIQQGGWRCSLVALGEDGPRALSITLGTALALYKSGVHAVVDGGLPHGVPCSLGVNREDACGETPLAEETRPADSI
jgi:hypothetical protein